MAITLKDIAKRARVTEMTVSNILNGRYNPTRDKAIQRAHRIRQIADELGYRPNAAAKAMAQGRFGCAALVMSNEFARSILPVSLSSAISQKLFEHDMHLVMAHLPDAKLTSTGFVPKVLRELMADGLLINYNAAIPQRMIDLIRDWEIPSIWLNSKQPTDAVHPDDEVSAHWATRHLIELGHRRIAYLDFTHKRGLETTHYSGVDRQAGYQAAMRQAALAPVVYGDQQWMWGGQSVSRMKELLAGPDAPTACLAYAGREARAAVCAAQILGMQLPRDLSVICFDDTNIHDVGPMISMMHLPETQVGEAAVEMLLTKIDDPHDALPTRAIAATLVQGETLAPAPRRATEA